jgi:hypothetical protein
LSAALQHRQREMDGSRRARCLVPWTRAGLVILKASNALCCALLLGILAVSVAAAQVNVQASDPAAVVTAYEMARNRGDVDQAAALFADDATLTQRSTIFTGREEIRRYLQNATGRGRFVVISNRKANGTQLTWTERPGGQNINGIEVNVEAIVQDGKIKALSYNGAPFAPRIEPNLEGRSQLPAVLGLGSVVLVLSGVVLVASAGLGHAQSGESSLRGRLMKDLRVWRSARSANG